MFVHERDTDEDGVFDEADGTGFSPVSTTLASALVSGSPYDISPDGRFVVFGGSDPVIGSGPTFAQQILVRAMRNGDGALVSMDADDTPANAWRRSARLGHGAWSIAFASEASNLTDETTGYDTAYRTPNPRR